jgi:molecular chaperone GrpE
MKIFNQKNVNDKNLKEEKVSATNELNEKSEDACVEFKNEAEKNLAGWKRAMADYENLHKRMLEEKLTARQEGIETSLSSLLVVLDYFDAAFSSIPDEISQNPWVKGVENIQKAFLNALLNHGVQSISEINIPFNPDIHEAVEHINDENIPAGNVIKIIANGYQRDSKTIRPAKVRVSNGKATQGKDDIGPPAQATQDSTKEIKPPEIKKTEESENNLIN